MTETAVVYSPKYLCHKTEPRHPESPSRLRVIMRELNKSLLLKNENCSLVEPESASIKDLKLVHDTDYIRLVLGMLEQVKAEGLAEYCDVFVEVGAFSRSQARTILEQAKKQGLKLRLHAGEFNDIGGAELGAELGATSIDHLDYISERGMELMAGKKTIGVLLPGVPFHLMANKYAPARKLIEAGVPIALATDFNPGSCPTLSMQMIIALACRQMKLTPAEAINAATINAAYALDRGDKIGNIEVGKRADIIVLDIPHHHQLPYWFGVNLVVTVIKNGVITY